MTNETHTQVKLQKQMFEQVTWVPSQFAKKGKYLKLRTVSGGDLFGEDGCVVSETSWDDSWKVTEVYNTKSTEEVREHSRDYRTQRRASDI